MREHLRLHGDALSELSVVLPRLGVLAREVVLRARRVSVLQLHPLLPADQSHLAEKQKLLHALQAVRRSLHVREALLRGQSTGQREGEV